MRMHARMWGAAVSAAAALAAHLSLAGDGGPRPAPQPDPARLRAWHDLLASEPHVAGTPGDGREIVRIAQAFRAMGLDTEVHEFWALLARPVSARVEVRGAGDAPPTVLPIIERELPTDPHTAHPDLPWGWNAYSGSGTAEGRVVYANYGTRADFDRLREWGIDCTGAVVIARYGGNFRGYKAKFAEAAGAAALLMYIDPADSGSGRGAVWPEGGGWANDTCIQRGSLLTLAWPGDPLTPGAAATRDAVRLEVDEVALPRIPVQPIGYAAASQILSRMRGREVPDAAWRGGLPAPYRLEGGPGLSVRVSVEQAREVRRSANVIARLRGAQQGAGTVAVGCHHDAWGFGAGDPLSGLVCVMELAQLLSDRAKAGERLPCDVIFCAWGAEEFGMIGSTEWVEANADALRKECLGYVNLDMAAMGPNLGAWASPSISAAVAGAIGLKPESVGPSGGGSDHVGFVCRVGVPSVGISASGAPGTSYHTNYDTLAWYRAIVGDDYASATAVARAAHAAIVALSGSAGASPVSATRVIDQALAALRETKGIAESAAVSLIPRFERLRECAVAWDALPAPATAQEQAERLAQRIALDRAWLDDAGLPRRSWYRNQFVAPDRDSGYASTVLPGLRDAATPEEVRAGTDALQRVADRIGSAICPITAGAGANPVGS